MNSMIDLPNTLQDMLALPRVHFRDRSLLPEVSGIYFVLYGAAQIRLAYVGKAENLRKRWVGHHRLPECHLLDTLGLAVELAWLELPSSDLDLAERLLIGRMLPPLNDRHGLSQARKRLSAETDRDLRTAAEIVSDYRARKEHAFELLASDDFWNACNSDDGDLLCVWAYPDGSALCDFNELWSQSDAHKLAPSRVPCPPSFAANTSGAAVPAPDYSATAAERRSWLCSVARQVDSWLVGVAAHQAAAVSSSVRREVLAALAQESSIEEQLTTADV